MSAKGKDLLEWMRETGRDAYGTVIPGDDIRELLGLVMPTYGSYSDFKSVELEELDATGYVRKVLLTEGKYLRSDKGAYRILLPSENAAQIEKYMTEADRKLRRALTLSQTTPGEHKNIWDTSALRAQRRLESIAETRTFGRPPEQPTAH